jgi:hypothetical protein
VVERKNQKAALNNNHTQASKTTTTQTQFQQVHLAVKKSARQDKRNYFNNALTEKAKASGRG